MSIRCLCNPPYQTWCVVWSGESCWGSHLLLRCKLYLGCWLDRQPTNREISASDRDGNNSETNRLMASPSIGTPSDSERDLSVMSRNWYDVRSNDTTGLWASCTSSGGPSPGLRPCIVSSYRSAVRDRGPAIKSSICCAITSRTICRRISGGRLAI